MKKKERGGEGMVDWESARTVEWRYLRDGERSRRDGKEPRQKGWIRKRGAKQRVNERTNKGKYRERQWKTARRGKQGMGGKKGTKDQRSFSVFLNSFDSLSVCSRQSLLVFNLLSWSVSLPLPSHVFSFCLSSLNPSLPLSCFCLALSFFYIYIYLSLSFFSLSLSLSLLIFSLLLTFLAPFAVVFFSLVFVSVCFALFRSLCLLFRSLVKTWFASQLANFRKKIKIGQKYLFSGFSQPDKNSSFYCPHPRPPGFSS